MSKELQNLAQGDVDTNGEEDVETVPINNNPVEERLVPKAVTSLAPQLVQQAVGPTLAPSFFTMDYVSSVKDSITSGVPNRRLTGEVDGSSRQPMVQNVE